MHRKDIVMGQRSQIYISWENENGENELIARYYGWNFGERMVSRAAGIMEHLTEMIESNNFDKEKLIKVSEINFDMRDVCQTSDLIKEAIDFSDGTVEDKKDYLFNADNNDGKLFIAVHKTGNSHQNEYGRVIPDRKIYYCFTDRNNEMVMDAKQYLQWNCDYGTNSGAKWEDGLDDETIAYTNKNIDTINELGERMVQKEFEYFMDYDYDCLHEGAEGKTKEKANEQAER